MNKEVAKKITNLIESQYNVLIPEAEFGRELTEFEKLGYDSLRVLELVSALEDELGISIDPVEDDLQQSFQNINAITNLVDRKLNDQKVLRDAGL